MKINTQKALLTSLIIYFIFFTFYGLPWGAPFFFHPDERNIASSVSQLSLSNFSPNFYAYGQLPGYLIYVIGLIVNLSVFRNFVDTVNFENAIIIGRLISAILTIILVYLIYRSSEILKNKTTAIFALIFSTTSVAFFQYSHFATFEIWLSTIYVLSALLLVRFLKSKNNLYFAAASALFGVSVGIKLSSIAFAPVLILPIVLIALENKKLYKKIFISIKYFLALLLISTAFYILTSPFNILDHRSFLDSMNYESGVATGSLPVFYTGSFVNKLPIFFQVERVLPFLLNPIITLIFVPCIGFATYTAFKKRDKAFFIYILSFFCLFISGTFLFAKWARYVVPSIPFLYILTAYGISNLTKNKTYMACLMVFFTLTGLIFSFSFLKTVRISQDTRIEALMFARDNIKKGSTILSEVYDLGIVPFNSYYKKIALYNFYDLDNGSPDDELHSILENTDAIIIPSQRIYESRTANPESFPKGSKFYNDLFAQKLGFKKVYETPCDIFCRITYFDPVFSVEQTINVFDRPTVFIFKK